MFGLWNNAPSMFLTNSLLNILKLGTYQEEES